MITYGRLFAHAAQALSVLKDKGIDITVLKLERIRPIPEEAVETAAAFKRVYFFEEGMEHGGVGESFFMALRDQGFTGSYELTGIKDKFVAQATVEQTLEELGIDCTGMVNKLTWN